MNPISLLLGITMAILPAQNVVFGQDADNRSTIDLQAPDTKVFSGHLKMGGKAPNGSEIGANSRYLTLNGKPWTPVMGEFHFSRYPHSEWENELCKMKAAGVTVVSSYIIWIHHQETEGKYDWTGDNDLRAFVQLCAKHGLYCFVRLGPWAHGEVRNGGFPDWLLKKCGKEVRALKEPYMTYVRSLYAEVGAQIRGLLWKDGGPVIGVQVENELTSDAPYLLALKNLALELGIDVPLYTVTGWGKAQIPQDEVLPMMGAYPDLFWGKEHTIWGKDCLPNYRFSLGRNDSSIGFDYITQRGETSAKVTAPRNPYLTCEIGGGMQIGYLRRPVIDPEDVGAISLIRIGNGSNLPGYYMFHGGRNPVGKLSTFQESRAQGGPNDANDLPVISYDFQAPLGQYGQRRASADALRIVNSFINEFGTELAPLTAVLPLKRPANNDDTKTLRWAARSDGQRGFLFVNNHQRIDTLPAHQGVQFDLRLKEETLTLPSKPVPIAKGAYFVWPFNMELGGALLKYAAAQPLCRVGDCVVFFEIPGIESEFVFAPKTLADGEREAVRGLKPGLDCIFTVRPKNGTPLRVLLLTQAQARQAWKANVWGAERLFISPASLYFPDANTVALESARPGELWADVFPAPAAALSVKGAPGVGLFARYAVTIPEAPMKPVAFRVSKPASQLPPLPEGWVAREPGDADFENAAVWHIDIPKNALAGVQDRLLRINYAGDAGRVYLNGKLIDDDFYSGKPFEIGLRRFAPEVLEKGLDLKILPLHKGAPVYIAKENWPDFGEASQIVSLKGVSIEAQYRAEITVAGAK